MNDQRVSYRNTFPTRFIASSATIAIILLLILLLINTLDPQARAARDLANYRQAQIDQALTPVDLFVAAGWRILPLLIIAGGTVLAGLIAYRRWATHEYIKAQHITAAIQADRQQYPAKLQTLTIHAGRQPLPVPPAALSPASTPLPGIEQPVTAPLFATLLEQGLIGQDSDGRRQPLILGYGLEGPIAGDWRSLYSTGLGGLQGSGKTWAATFLLAQSALNGARLVIGDPHAGDSESLAARTAPLASAFLCDIADDDRSILAALQLADDELQRRKGGHPERWPLIVAIDEWTSLRRGKLAEILPELIEDFTTEGRKLNCHLMLLAQRWDKDSVGDFRNTLASAYVHRMRPAEARMMTGLPASVMPNDTLQLAPGECYLLDTRGQLIRVRIPLMTPDDLVIVGQRLHHDTDKPARPFGFQPPSQQPKNSQESVTNQPNNLLDYSSPESGIALTPEAARIIALFLEGKDAGAIVTELTDMTSKAGKPYLIKLAEVQAIIREALRQQRARGQHSN